MTDASEKSREPDSGKALLSRSDDRLSIFFIGAGSAFTKRYYQNNALVVKGDDHLLIDCGTRAPEALTRLGLSVTDIDTYLITHSHADHIGGLEEVMLLNRYMAGKRPTMVAPAAYRKYLWKHSLKGGAAYNERREGRFLRFEDLWDAVDLEPVPGADRQLCETSVGSIRLAMFRTRHIPDSAPSWRSCAPSYGVVIDGRVLYTSDTRYDPEMLRFVEERYAIEAAFHDCQLFTGGVHASLDELAGLPPALKAKTLLMHYGDAVDSAEAKAETLGFKGFARQWTPYLFG